MNIERLFQRFKDFKKTLAQLKIAQDQPKNDLVRDAVIQRFEVTYELAWKTVKLYLEIIGVETRNPKETIREALQQGLIEDGNGWSLLHQMRNLTRHTYDEHLAEDVYDYVKQRGVNLFAALQDELIHKMEGEQK